MNFGLTGCNCISITNLRQPCNCSLGFFGIVGNVVRDLGAGLVRPKAHGLGLRPGRADDRARICTRIATFRIFATECGHTAVRSLLAARIMSLSQTRLVVRVSHRVDAAKQQQCGCTAPHGGPTSRRRNKRRAANASAPGRGPGGDPPRAV